MIITIDGPSGTGKSTVAKKVAEKLGFTYFDTGAMFRTIAYGILVNRIDYKNHEILAHFLQTAELSLKNHQGKTHFYLNGSDVTSHLRTAEVTSLSSKISTIKEVRDKLGQLQRDLVKGISAVFEGRDMGTVIFPNAETKIFLTAEPAVRAKRRYHELVAKDATFAESHSFEKTLQDIQERDERDENREIAPLKAAKDAHLVDTSNLSIDEVVDHIIFLIKS